MVVRQLVLGLVGVGALALVVLKGPSCMLERADLGAKRCFDDYDEVHGKGVDLAGCRQGGWLSIPKRMPHTRRQALEREKETESSILYRVMRAGTAREATAEQRKRAIDAALRSDKSPSYKASDLLSLGAFEQAAAIDILVTEKSDNDPLHAALLIGNIPRAKALVMQGSPKEEYVGAVACLLGVRERGLALLAKISVTKANLHTPARIAALLCGATASSFGGQDPNAEPDLLYEASMVARALDPAFQVGRRRVLGQWLRKEVTLEDHVKVAGTALALGTEPLDPLEVFRLVVSDDGVPLDGVVRVSPWMVLRAESYSGKGLEYIPPSWLATAGARVDEALAKPAPKIALDRDDDLAFELRRLDPAFMKNPHAALRVAAARIHAFAAAYALRGGDRDVAREAIGKLRAFAPDSLDLAVLELAVGEPKLALETIARWEAKPAPAVDDDKQASLASVAVVNRVLALAALGDHAAAHAAARKGNTRDPIIGWLVLATAIAAKAPLADLPITMKQDSTDDAARWAAALATGKDPPRGYDLDAEIVMPAVMLVMGHAATVVGGDPEAYLDDRFSHLDVPSRMFMRARAEAARWRGDAAAAKRWDDRATGIEALFVDDRTTALAGIAGLW